MRVSFVACDRNSSAFMQEAVSVTTVNELTESYTEFSNRVPFSKWFSNNVVDDEEGASDELIEAVDALD